jgi:hypothetical protein
MEFNPSRRNKALLVTFGLILLAIILALIAPEEKTLGNYIRLIYIHAAVTWVGMAMFAISGLCGFFYFLTLLTSGKSDSNAQEKSRAFLNWSSAGQSTAISFWTASVILGSIAAYFTWGGDWWVEPRLQTAATILLMAVFVHVIRIMVDFKSLQAGLNFGLPAAALLLLLKTGKLVHPNNAFAKSDSLSIKIYAGLITLVFIVVAVNATWFFATKLKNREKEARLLSQSGAST